MMSDMSQRCTIEMLSQQYHINTSTLKSLFKTVYGQPLAAHMKEHRMEYAARLLRTTTDSLAEIAEKVGYESQSKPTAAFKSAYGLPSEYRKEKKTAALDGQPETILRIIIQNASSVFAEEAFSLKWLTSYASARESR